MKDKNMSLSVVIDENGRPRGLVIKQDLVKKDALIIFIIIIHYRAVIVFFLLIMKPSFKIKDDILY
jgi:hypothetical protein